MLGVLRDRQKWKDIRENPAYEPLRNLLFDAYEKDCRDKDIPMIKFSDEEDFFKTGKRARFEELYFLRRRQLTVYALLSVIYPENDGYLEKLEDIICEICNEYSWQVPAHRNVANRNKRDGLSLFSCETGLYLAEIKYMLSERLSHIVIDRITDALNFRIMKSFERNDTPWIESLKSNWASVCGASIGMVFMYESAERFSKIQPRINNFMSNYLKSVLDDGTTSEGATYWNYGLSFYVMYYDNLRFYSSGRGRNGLNEEKIKKFGSFYSNLLLDDDVAASFSDGSAKSEYCFFLANFLKKEYNIDVPSLESGYLWISKFSLAARAFLYFDPEYYKKGKEPVEFEKYYDKLGLYIKRCGKYGFSLKGGNNGEEHNHNDIGSFILAKNNKQILCDLGAGEYTAFNFGKDRYKILNNSSRGHSVPIINNSEQGTGAEFSGEIKTDGGLSIDISGAYPLKLKKFKRSFDFKKDAVILTDSFDGDIDIKERFVTEIKPEISDDKITIDCAELYYEQGWKPSVSSEEIPAHGGMKIRTVYLIDFAPDKKTDKFILEIRL